MNSIASYMEIALGNIIWEVDMEGWRFEKACKYERRQFTREQIPDDAWTDLVREAHREIYGMYG